MKSIAKDGGQKSRLHHEWTELIEILMCDWSCSDDLRATPQIAVLDSMEAPKLGIADGQIPPEYAELYSA